MTARYLFVTVDTEVDKDLHWRIGDPVRFRSVCEGIPRVFSPLFDRHGVKPTYFLSPEVLEDAACVGVLRQLGDRAELGTHLHSEFIEPERSLYPANMAGAAAQELQLQLPRDTEARKLANLTQLYERSFGYRPTAFRAGRYGISANTLEILAGLGYTVDSSVTPGMRWDYDEGVVDFREWRPAPSWVHTGAGAVLEVPISIQPRGPLAGWLRDAAPRLYRVAARMVGDSHAFNWLRPSWNSGEQLIRYVERSDERFLTLMLHSTEIIPGASPYARSDADVTRIVASMDALFAHCANRGIQFCGVSDAVGHV